MIQTTKSIRLTQKTKSWKCLAPAAFSGVEFHEDSKNAIIFGVAQDLGVPGLIWSLCSKFATQIYCDSFFKKSYEVKGFLILLTLSEINVYNITVIFWKFWQNQKAFYFIRFFHKLLKKSKFCEKILWSKKFSDFAKIFRKSQ